VHSQSKAYYWEYTPNDRRAAGYVSAAAGPIATDSLTSRFKRAQPERIAELLETLVIVGHAHKLPAGRYTGKV